jgi:hypothetical protein
LSEKFKLIKNSKYNHLINILPFSRAKILNIWLKYKINYKNKIWNYNICSNTMDVKSIIYFCNELSNHDGSFLGFEPRSFWIQLRPISDFFFFFNFFFFWWLCVYSIEPHVLFMFIVVIFYVAQKKEKEKSFWIFMIKTKVQLMLPDIAHAN